LPTQIAASDFTFNNETEAFQEGLDRPIEQRLQNRSPDSFPARSKLRAST
jgi:hypothetical protein